MNGSHILIPDNRFLVGWNAVSGVQRQTFLKISFPISLSIFLRMQPLFPHNTRKWEMLTAPVWHASVSSQELHKTLLSFSPSKLQFIKTHANTSACIIRPHAHSYTKRKGWRVNYTLLINLTNHLSLIKTHTCSRTRSLFPCAQATWYHFGKAKSGRFWWNQATELVREMAVATT